MFAFEDLICPLLISISTFHIIIMYYTVYYDLPNLQIQRLFATQNESTEMQTLGAICIQSFEQV